MSVREQIEAMRDEAKGFQDQALLDLAKQYYGGQVDMANYILELLPVLAEVEGWLPSTVLPGKEHILWSFMTKKMEPTDRHVRIIILQGESDA